MIDDTVRHIIIDNVTVIRYNICIPNNIIGENMTIDQHTYDALSAAFSPVPPEAGGILGSRNGCICVFVYDPGIPDISRNCYTPDVDFLNRVIEQWQEEGITFCGIVHSHPAGHRKLSNVDLAYIQTIMNCMPAQIRELYFPVIIPGEGIFPYQARRDGTVIPSFFKRERNEHCGKI